MRRDNRNANLKRTFRQSIDKSFELAELSNDLADITLGRPVEAMGKGVPIPVATASLK